MFKRNAKGIFVKFSRVKISIYFENFLCNKPFSRKKQNALLDRRCHTEYQLTKAKFLSPLERNQLLKTLEMLEGKDARNVAILRLYDNTGARPSEVLNLRVKDLYPESSSVFIRGLKGSRSREIPIPKSLFKQVQTFAGGKGPEELLFPISLRTMQGIWHLYRPCKKGLRCLRHTFAIRLYEKTKDIRLVQTALGHKSLMNTQVYSEYVYNQQELRRLIL